MLTKLRQQSAFTLIELLVVITIVSLISGVLVLSVNSVKQENIPEVWLKHFANQVDYTQDAAVLSNKNFAIQFSQAQYRFLTYQKRQWEVYDKEPLSNKSNQLPKSSTVVVNVSSKRLPLSPDFKEIVPHVLINNTGTMTPFELNLHHSDGDSNLRYDFSGKATHAVQ